jgi:hypothetical protein
MIILSAVPLALFVFKMAKMFYLYRSRVKATITQTLASAVAGLALSHTISKAILFGMVSKSLPFFRTPKKVEGRPFWYALQSAREEGMIALALLIAAYALIRAQDVDPPPDTIVWIVVLLVQSIPYLAAVGRRDERGTGERGGRGSRFRRVGVGGDAFSAVRRWLQRRLRSWRPDPGMTTPTPDRAGRR